MKKIKINPLIFKLQSRGGISTLWRVLLYSQDEGSESRGENLDSQMFSSLTVSSALRVNYARKNEIIVNTYHTITLGTGKSICVCHDLMEEKNASWRNLIKRIYIFFSYYFSSRIICISKRTQREFHDYYPNLANKTIVIPNPLSSVYVKSYHSEVIKKTQEKISLLYVGQRNGNKNFDEGLDLLLHVFPEKFKLSCIGPCFSNCEKKKYKDLIQSDVLAHLGSPDNKFLPSLYRSADFLFLPSIDEGFGYPIIEALATKTPVMAMYPEALHIINGISFFHITRSTSNSDLQAFLEAWALEAKKAQNQIISEFSIDKIRSQYVAAIENL